MSTCLFVTAVIASSTYLRYISRLHLMLCGPVMLFYFAPTDSPEALHLEGAVFAGGMLVSFAYGLYISITASCVYYMFFRTAGSLKNRVLLGYICVLSISSTTLWISTWIWSQMVLIGGRIGVSADTISNAALVINGSLANALTTWRCYVIWDHNGSIIVLPVLCYVLSLVYAILTLRETTMPGSAPWSIGNSTITYLSLNLGLNVLLMTLIISRLVRRRRAIRTAFGPSHAKQYTGLAALLIESAALHSLTSVLIIVAFSVSSHVSAVAMPLLGEVVCIAPMLILLRVAFGQAYPGAAHLDSSPTVGRRGSLGIVVTHMGKRIRHVLP